MCTVCTMQELQIVSTLFLLMKNFLLYELISLLFVCYVLWYEVGVCEGLSFQPYSVVLLEGGASWFHGWTAVVVTDDSQNFILGINSLVHYAEQTLLLWLQYLANISLERRPWTRLKWSLWVFSVFEIGISLSWKDEQSPDTLVSPRNPIAWLKLTISSNFVYSLLLNSIKKYLLKF